MQTFATAGTQAGSSKGQSERSAGRICWRGNQQEISADLPANTQVLSPRLCINNRATAAAVTFDCAAVCLETDY